MQDVGGMLVYADFQTKNHHWILKGCGIAAARMGSPKKKKNTIQKYSIIQYNIKRDGLQRYI